MGQTMNPARAQGFVLPVSLLLNVAFAIAIATLLSGCSGVTEVTETDQLLRIRFSTPVRALTVGVPAAVMLGFSALFLVRRNRLNLIIAGAGALVLLRMYYSPIFIESVTVTPHYMNQAAGWGWSHTFSLDAVFRYEHVEYIVTMPERWEVHHKNGRVQDIDPGYLWKEHETLIKVRLQEYGVPFR